MLYDRRRRAKIIGFVDGLEGSTIRGWAADSRAWDDSLEITVTADGRVIGKGKADQMRPDLVAAGYGKGLHGFVVPLSDMSWAPTSLEVAASKPDANHAKASLPWTSIANIQIAHAYNAGLQIVEPPRDIYDTCQRVREGCFSAPDQAPTDAEQVFFSDACFAKTMLACAVKT